MATVFEANGIKIQKSEESDAPSDLLVTGFTFPDRPEHTIPAMVFKQTKEKVQQLATQSTSPTTSEASDISYKVAKSTTAGRGLFATRGLKTGDLILSERPIMVTRAALPSDLQQIETFLQILFGRLQPEDQILYSELQNPKSPHEAGPLLGRLRANGFTFSPYPNAPPHAGIFPTFAKCNHSCGPNAQARFEYSTWAIELRATRAIKQNEEITISYVDGLQDALKRRAQLSAIYEFLCRCKWCSLPTDKRAESDKRRVEIEKWAESKLVRSEGKAVTPEFLVWHGSSSNSGDVPPDPSQLITKSITSMVTAAKEGLEPFSWMHAMTLYLIYAELGDEKNFRRWRAASRDLILLNLGKTPEYDTANLEMEDPEKHVHGWARWRDDTKMTAQ